MWQITVTKLTIWCLLFLDLKLSLCVGVHFLSRSLLQLHSAANECSVAGYRVDLPFACNHYGGYRKTSAVYSLDIFAFENVNKKLKAEETERGENGVEGDNNCHSYTSTMFLVMLSLTLCENFIVENFLRKKQAPVRIAFFIHFT